MVFYWSQVSFPTFTQRDQCTMQEGELCKQKLLDPSVKFGTLNDKGEPVIADAGDFVACVRVPNTADSYCPRFVTGSGSESSPGWLWGVIGAVIVGAIATAAGVWYWRRRSRAQKSDALEYWNPAVPSNEGHTGATVVLLQGTPRNGPQTPAKSPASRAFRNILEGSGLPNILRSPSSHTVKRERTAKYDIPDPESPETESPEEDIHFESSVPDNRPTSTIAGEEFYSGYTGSAASISNKAFPVIRSGTSNTMRPTSR